MFIHSSYKFWSTNTVVLCFHLIVFSFAAWKKLACLIGESKAHSVTWCLDYLFNICAIYLEQWKFAQ